MVCFNSIMYPAMRIALIYARKGGVKASLVLLISAHRFGASTRTSAWANRLRTVSTDLRWADAQTHDSIAEYWAFDHKDMLW